MNVIPPSKPPSLSNMKTNERKDAEEIVRRLRERNPAAFNGLIDENITLEDFAEIVIVQYKAFNAGAKELRPDKNVKVPDYVWSTEGYDPSRLPK
jgi:hypothetical protein